jgi:hypothetical protein
VQGKLPEIVDQAEDALIKSGCASTSAPASWCAW